MRSRGALIALLLTWSCLFGVRAWALSPEFLSSEQILEARLLTLIRTYDPSALVSVHIEPREETTRLPLTPFQARDLTFRDRLGNAEIRSIRIQLFTRLNEGKIPDPVINIVRSSLSGIQPSPTIVAQKLPEVMARRQEATDSELEGNSKQREWLKSSLGTAIKLALALGGGLIFVLFFGVLVSVGQSRRSLGTLVGVIKEAMLDWSKSSDSPKEVPRERDHESAKGSVATDDPGAAPVRATPATPVASRLSDRIYENLTEEQWLALISDAYWCEEDGYAHFLWSLMPPAIQRELHRKWSFLADYIQAFLRTPPIDQGWVLDPSYLDPLPIFNLNLRDLGKALLKEPGLYGRLSRVRKSKLQVGLADRIKLERGSIKTAGASTASFSKLVEGGSSPARMFELDWLPISSIEEEQKLLEQSGEALPEEIKRRIPSLAWLRHRSESELREKLDEYTARELAQIWIGPEETLNWLSGLLNARKLELLKKSQEKIKPSRENSVFRELMQFAFAKGPQDAQELRKTA